MMTDMKVNREKFVCKENVVILLIDTYFYCQATSL